MQSLLRSAWALALAVGIHNAAQAQVDWQDPAAEPQSAAAAQFASDEYAWRLFVALSWPADFATRSADRSKALGAEGPVVWESWKNAKEVFLTDGVDPGPWVDPGIVPAPLAPEARFDPLPLQQVIRLEQLNQPLPAFDPQSPTGNETRLNKEAYEFVRANELYHQQGQLAFFTRGEDLNFPLAAKEIKAQWRRINPANRAKYHTAEVPGPGNTTIVFGLTSLHITTKDIPNWLWATFEHVDNPNRPDNEGWLLASRDTFACKGLAPDCNRAPAGIGLQGTKWENYRLRGTQIEFVDARGAPTLLANSQPENGFQTTSSCITCHARAAIGQAGAATTRLSVFDGRLNHHFTERQTVRGYIGVPDEDWFWADTSAGRRRLFVQQDFVWALSRADRKP